MKSPDVININKEAVLDIIIPTFKKPRYVETCVKSLKGMLKGLIYNIIVVEDGDTLIEPEIAENLGFTYLATGQNGGFSKTVNYGLKFSEAKYKLFLNNDTIALNDFASILVGRLESDPKIGAVGAKLLYPNNTLQFAGHTRNPFHPKWFDHKYRGQDKDFLPANRATPVISLTGACLLVTEEVLQKVKEKYGHYGLDEGYPMAFEDVDFCFKIRRLGFDCWYEPKAELIHYEGGTRGVGQQSIDDPRQKVSIKYFWQTWSEEDVDELSALGFE